VRAPWSASAAILALLASPIAAARGSDFAEVYVQDFHSDEPESCTNADVSLSHAQARQFFVRSRPVSSRAIHDHHDVAPCYLEGTMRFRGRLADWKIQPSGIGLIIQGGRTRYYVCDSCDAMFERK